MEDSASAGCPPETDGVTTCSYASSSEESEEDGEEIWDDWVEDVPNDAQCLFCEMVSSSPSACMEHMSSDHDFNFRALQIEWSLDFYESVKLVNFIRQQVKERICIRCGEQQDSENNLLAHMKSQGHFFPARDADFWKNQEYSSTI